jgi:hypothetical protein
MRRVGERGGKMCLFGAFKNTKRDIQHVTILLRYIIPAAYNEGCITHSQNYHCHIE